MIPGVLFVCLGNICRSPLAEGALRAEAARLNLDLTVDSAGTGNWLAGVPVAGPGRVDDDLQPQSGGLGPQRALGQGRATDVAEADEQDARDHRRPNSFSRSLSLSST